jgi:hypothetical protein
LRAIGADDDADNVTGMLGEALLRSGSVAEAEIVLRDLLDGLALDSPSRETAVKVYEETRRALGSL